MIADAGQRAAALDPGHSFIVEAPAGSGKTELLTQRYLRLLALVERPEQIVAITFTRKAAAEMRQRIVASLRAAADPDCTVPEHRRVTVELARTAGQRSDDLGWSLLANTQRLRVLTIDALNASLARQLPVMANGIGSAEVTDDAGRLYRMAARRTADGLAERSDFGDGLRTLMAASGNTLTRLEAWLASVLPERDRWLRLFRQAEIESLNQAVADNLQRLQQRQIASVRSLAGPGLESRLAALLERRAGYLDPATGAGGTGGNPDASGFEPAIAIWRAAAGLLLTGEGRWRQRFTRREGIPPDDDELRRELGLLLTSLQSTPGLREALVDLAALPDGRAEREQGALLDALLPVLKRLLAELRIVFAETQTVDHTELALTALQALGSVDAPSELLLALDRRIEHMLVDEFQDTSHLQWSLLELLTAGWEAGDGRSLFIVGDPMQSIYRFRDADLSLFLRAARDGIGQVPLRAVRLSVNFRSAPALVDWVNSTFAPIFAATGAADPGAPPFRPATPGKSEQQDTGVEVHDLAGADHAAEMARVVEIVQRELADSPDRSIGILVRSRAHLLGLRAALAAAGMPAHAVEIDSLTDTQAGLDLVTLAAALLHEGDRLAWLSLLRSPCCGLGWGDLLLICGDDSERTVWSALSDAAVLGRLTDDGARRARWLRERLALGRSLRPCESLGRWLRACWLLIDGPAALATASELESAERFFRDMDRLGRGGDVDDPARLREWFSRPSGGEVPAESGIEIMTIHRAKGLEFDTVVLPALGRTTRGSSYSLLLLKEIILDDLDRIGLVAAASRAAGSLHAYLRRTERDQDAAERARLLYVAATRARERLHLIGSCAAGRPSPRSGSLLETLWPGIDWQADRAATGVVATRAGDTDAGGSEEAATAALIEVPLRRLFLADSIPLPANVAAPAEAEPAARPEFEWVNPASVQVGTLIHAELQRWAERAANDGVLSAPRPEPERYRRDLALLGVEPEDLSSAAERVVAALELVWQDPTGRWILQPRPEAWSELRLSVRAADRIEHIRLDRSFVSDDGQRWIIDFKTGRHLGADVDAFLDAELLRYQRQLETYAHAVAAIDSRPLRVALYFPLMGRLKEWAPDQAAGG